MSRTTQTDLVQQLATLLQQTGEAHHQAFIEADGVDPEWPLWYAEHLHENLPALLDAELTKAEIVYLLLSADRQRGVEAPGSNWPRFYAKLWVARYH